jgi:hypothetical protein
LSKLLLKLYNGYPEIKDTKQVGGEWKSPTVKVAAIQLTAQSLLPVILICFACKETSGRPEVSRR